MLRLSTETKIAWTSMPRSVYGRYVMDFAPRVGEVGADPHFLAPWGLAATEILHRSCECSVEQEVNFPGYNL